MAGVERLAFRGFYFLSWISWEIVAWRGVFGEIEGGEYLSRRWLDLCETSPSMSTVYA